MSNELPPAAFLIRITVRTAAEITVASRLYPQLYLLGVLGLVNFLKNLLFYLQFVVVIVFLVCHLGFTLVSIWLWLFGRLMFVKVILGYLWLKKTSFHLFQTFNFPLDLQFTLNMIFPYHISLIKLTGRIPSPPLMHLRRSWPSDLVIWLLLRHSQSVNKFDVLGMYNQGFSMLHIDVEVWCLVRVLSELLDLAYDRWSVLMSLPLLYKRFFLWLLYHWLYNILFKGFIKYLFYDLLISLTYRVVFNSILLTKFT